MNTKTTQQIEKNPIVEEYFTIRTITEALGIHNFVGKFLTLEETKEFKRTMNKQYGTTYQLVYVERHEGHQFTKYLKQ